MNWEPDTGRDVTSAFLGITTPQRELYDEIHKRGWTVEKVHVKDNAFLAVAKNPHKEKIEARGNTEQTAVGNLLMKVMRREHIRSSAQQKVGMWQITFEDQLEEIASAYAEAPIYDPKDASAWHELARDSEHRADVLRSQLKVEVVNDPAPYKTADELRKDVSEKQHIFVTQAQASHPIWTVDQMVAYRLVHDVLGHCVGGGDWGWHGENLACAAHLPLLSESAQQALFTEALGQTAFGTVYRQWGPQKIVFLEDHIKKVQEKENKPGHSPVHPSQSLAPAKIPHMMEKGGSVVAPNDPNQNWQSHISPLPDNAYLWQTDPQTGTDPLDAEGTMENARRMDAGVANMPDPLRKQAVANAFRATLLAPRKNLMNNAVHYQHIMGLPADIDDPMAYWDLLEQQRENHNQSLGLAPQAHQTYWPELQQYKRWVRAQNPHLDDGEVSRSVKRDLMHMTTEEEQRLLRDDKDGLLSAEDIESLVNPALQKRLKLITKSNIDDKHDFGDARHGHSDTLGSYGSFLASHLHPIAAVAKHADALSEAARSDFADHRGAGHHFRSSALSLGIPGIGPKEASMAWTHLAPQTSQLATIDPHMMEILGHKPEEMNDRDYFKFERELTAARDASGYGHLPLGAFGWGLWDQKQGGPGHHQDQQALRVHAPQPHQQIDWGAKAMPQDAPWSAPYWWDQTQEARDQVGKDWDQTVAPTVPSTDIPFQRAARVASPGVFPYFIHPQSGEEVEGQSGQSLMSHIKQSLGNPSTQDVWASPLVVGKR